MSQLMSQHPEVYLLVDRDLELLALVLDVLYRTHHHCSTSTEDLDQLTAAVAFDHFAHQQLTLGKGNIGFVFEDLLY
jgi:hypothetical protein